MSFQTLHIGFSGTHISEHWRPTGVDPSAYRGWQQWSMERWAWEFLRRNKHFQKACDHCAAPPDPAEAPELKKLAALVNGLTAYKHYAEPYSGTGLITPRFLMPGVRQMRTRPGSSRVVLNVTQGDFLVKINVSSFKTNTDLEAHVSWYRKTLEHLRAAIRQEPNAAELPRKNSPNPETLVQYLRLLDASEAKVRLHVIGPLVRPDKVPPAGDTEMENSDWRDLVKGPLSRARKMRDGQWRALVGIGDFPE